MSSLIKPAIDRQIIEGLIRFIELHERRTSGQAPISKIYLMGGGSELKNLPNYIQTMTGLPTVQVRELEGVSTNQREETELYMPYLPLAIAATTGKGMNLLPDYYFKSRQNKRYIVLLLVLLLVESMAAGIKAYQPIAEEKLAHKRLDELEVALQDPKFAEVKEVSQALGRQISDKETWENIISQVKTEPFIEVTALDTLVANLPAGVTIDQLTMSEG